LNHGEEYGQNSGIRRKDGVTGSQK